MGALTSLLGRRVYLDTNIVIYALEGYEAHADFLGQLLAALQQGHFAGVTSELTLAELLVGPFQLQRPDVASEYGAFLQSSKTLTVFPVTRAVLIEAARQRAAYRLALPDAIHVATALAASFDVFLTNDRRLKVPPDLSRHLI
jgi:predicted nucleic acid-binding protein